MKLPVIILVMILLSSCAILHKSKFEPPEEGLLIINFTEDSSLKEKGAKVKDVLWKYDGKIVNSVSELDELKKAVTGEKVEVVLKRGEKTISVQIPAGKIGVYLLPVPHEHQVDKDAVIIDGIGKVGWGQDMDVSFFGCLLQIETYLGSNLDYDDLLVLSGYGMRTSFFEGFCPSSPDATCGYDCGSKILEKLGYEYEYYFLDETKDELNFPELNYKSHEDMRNLIVSSIDSQMPVLAVDLIQLPEWGIITGYQKAGSEFFCRTYYDQSNGYEIARKFPWVIIILKEKNEKPLTPLFGQLLEEANTILTEPEIENYKNGITALQQWISDLNEQELSKLEQAKYHEIGFANTWIYYSLMIARTKNAFYLEKHINDFSVPHDTVNILVKLYKEEAETLQHGMADLPPMEANITPEIWTPEMRQKQISSLKKILSIEEKILDIVKTI